jgi:hypothetical protein
MAESTASPPGYSLLDPDDADLQAMSSSHPIFRLLTRVNTPTPFLTRLRAGRGTIPSDLSKPPPSDFDVGDYTETERFISFGPPSSPEDSESEDEEAPELPEEDENPLGDFSDVFAFLESQKAYWQERKVTCESTRASKGGKKKRRGIRGKNKAKSLVDQRLPSSTDTFSLPFPQARCDPFDHSEAETLVPGSSGEPMYFVHGATFPQHLDRDPFLSSPSTPFRTSTPNAFVTPEHVLPPNLHAPLTPGLSSSESTAVFGEREDGDMDDTDISLDGLSVQSGIMGADVEPHLVPPFHRAKKVAGVGGHFLPRQASMPLRQPSEKACIPSNPEIGQPKPTVSGRSKSDHFSSPGTQRFSPFSFESDGIGHAGASARKVRAQTSDNSFRCSPAILPRDTAVGVKDTRTSRPTLRHLATVEKERSLTNKLVSLFGSIGGTSAFYPARVIAREGPAPTARTSTRRYYQAERMPGDDEGQVAVFIDNSNVVIGFIEWAKKMGWSKPRRPRLDYVTLLAILERGRSVWRRVLVGSTPLHQGLETVFKHNYDIALLEVCRVPRRAVRLAETDGRVLQRVTQRDNRQHKATPLASDSTTDAEIDDNTASARRRGREQVGLAAPARA